MLWGFVLQNGLFASFITYVGQVHVLIPENKPAFINDCQRKDGRSIPPLIEFPQDLRVTLRGHIGGGRITIQQHSDHDRAGSIETTVQATDRILNKTTYCVDLGHETIFDINFPSSWFLSWGARVEMTIKMPYHATRLLVDTSNMPVEIVRDTMMDVIHVKTTNNSIKITDDWDGKRMELETTNSSIEADRARIYADEAVKFSTTNAQIKVDKVIVSEQGTLQLKTTNAKIEGREVRAGTSVRLDTTNATIDVAYISALNGPVQVQTSNAKIVSEDIQAGSKIDLLTSNASIKATYLRGPWIDAKTSNSSIGLGKVLVANRLMAETSFGELNANIEALSPDLNATFSTTFSNADIHMVRQSLLLESREGDIHQVISSFCSLLTSKADLMCLARTRILVSWIQMNSSS